jgi:membrane protein DedA with SNARE-associated domain
MSSLIALLAASKYVLFFLGTLTEGPLVMISGGFFYHLGQVLFWPTYLALVAGDFAADLLWYVVGYWGARPFFNRYGHYFDITPAIIGKIERRFHHYSDWILVISKLTMGFGLALATLTVAGMLRVSFWRYAAINLVCGFIWTFFLFAIGYFFGNVYELIPGYLNVVFAILTFLVFFFGIKAASRYLARSEW